MTLALVRCKPTSTDYFDSGNFLAPSKSPLSFSATAHSPLLISVDLSNFLFSTTAPTQIDRETKKAAN